MFIGGDDAGYKAEQGFSFSLRERRHDRIPHGEDSRIKSGKQFTPLRCETEKASAVTPHAIRSANEPSALKVLHHPLNMDKIGPDPLR